MSSSQVCAVALACLVAQLLLLAPHIHGSPQAGSISFSQQGGSDCLWADLVVGEAAPSNELSRVTHHFAPRIEAPRAAHRTHACLADAPKQGPP